MDHDLVVALGMETDVELVPSTSHSRLMLGDLELMLLDREAPPIVESEPAAPLVIWNNLPPPNVEPEPAAPLVDWNNLEIVERQDEEGRIEMISEEQMYVLLGLRDEDERAKTKEQENNAQGRTVGRTDYVSGTEGAAIVVNDSIPDEIVITYDKDNPSMALGTMYPTMDEFRMALRQFAINKEFDLGTEKSDKKRFRGFCKSSVDCPWRIVASRQDDNRTVKVTVVVD